MLDETSYEVKISEVAQVIEVEIVNEYVHGNIKLTKVDEDYPDNKLTGATFEVYKDVNGDGKLDDADELIGTLSETSTGIYEMKELLYGKYLVRETKAPDGFELDKGVYSVFIEKDETTYEVENKAGVGFINTAMKGNLKIVKTSSDGKVEGFTFRVTGVNGTTEASRPIRTAKSLSRDFVSAITPFPRFRIVFLLPMCFLRIRLQP